MYSIAEFWNITLNYFSVYFRLVLVHWDDEMLRPGSAATCWRGPLMSRCQFVNLHQYAYAISILLPSSKTKTIIKYVLLSLRVTDLW